MADSTGPFKRRVRPLRRPTLAELAARGRRAVASREDRRPRCEQCGGWLDVQGLCKKCQ